MIWEHRLVCCRKSMQTKLFLNALSYLNQKMNLSSFPKTTGFNTLRTRGVLNGYRIFTNCSQLKPLKAHMVLLLNSLPNKSKILESLVCLGNISSIRRSIKMALICCLESWLACKYFSSIVIICFLTWQQSSSFDSYRCKIFNYSNIHMQTHSL